MGPGAGSQNTISVIAHNQTGTNTAVSFSYNPPTITSFSTTQALTSGGDSLTITGTNLGSSVIKRSVTVAGKNCPIISSNSLHTQLICQLPPGEGLNKEVKVQVSDQTTSSFTFAYDAPIIQSLSSSTGPTSGSTLNSLTWLTIYGKNFGTSNATVSVTIGSSSVLSCSSCLRNHTMIQVRIPPGEGLVSSLMS